MEDQYLPISKMNTMAFCSRRYFIEAVLGDEVKNQHLVEGQNLHNRSQREGENTWVWSDRLHLVGIVDKLEQEEAGLVPVEYKKGWLAEHISDQVQLAAELMCLREMGKTKAQHGYLYYHTTHRRLRVDLTLELTKLVEQTAQQMRAMQQQQHYPPVTTQRSKCKGCSVKEVCQPTLKGRV